MNHGDDRTGWVVGCGLGGPALNVVAPYLAVSLPDVGHSRYARTVFLMQSTSNRTKFSTANALTRLLTLNHEK
jgi:hypothetical protein